RRLSYLIGKRKQTARLSILTVFWTVINQTKIFQVWSGVLVKDCLKRDSYNNKNSILVSQYL
ncbi:MAG: hypothetical protein O4752_09570, partial [Trichodesmium sp. St4_bin8_1]|nr:hypothetical protein [Trichodesmium sp. St4_bin8_1]